MIKVNKIKVKNALLFLTFIIGTLPTVFFGSEYRVNLSLFVERSTRIDFFAMYYANSINYLILAYCLFFPNGIDRRISLFIYIVTILDFFHLALFSMRGNGMSKILIAIIVYLIVIIINPSKNDNN